MEPDLDRLLDFEYGGSLFPQFRKVWDELIAAALVLKERVESTDARRVRVAIKSAEAQSFCSVFLALSRSRIDLFLFNPQWGASEEKEARRIADPHWIVGDFAEGRFQCARIQDADNSIRARSNDLRVMIPTGGSTGGVRFAIHDWRSLSASAYGFQFYFQSDNIVSHCVLPLYHVSGFMQLVRSLLTVGQIVFGRVENFKECHDSLRDIEGTRFLSLVPTQLERLMGDRSVEYMLRLYRAIFVGGGPIAIGILEEARSKKLPLAPTYGMTETAAQVATLKPDAFLKGGASVGPALPHATIRIIDAATGTPAKRGSIDRIQIASASLFRGYYGDSPFDGDSIITNDLGALDDRNRLFVYGRADRVIVTGGEKVNLREIESKVEETGLVKDVVAFGVDDREWGQRLACAFVPRSDSITADAVRLAMADALANFKQPKSWLRLDSLPRSEAGKILVSDLVAQATSA